METLEELQNRAIEVFKSIRKQGLKLNKKKYVCIISEVMFSGQRIAGEGYLAKVKYTLHTLKKSWPLLRAHLGSFRLHS